MEKILDDRIVLKLHCIHSCWLIAFCYCVALSLLCSGHKFWCAELYLYRVEM